MKTIEENKRKRVVMLQVVADIEDENLDLYDRYLLSGIITLHRSKGCFASNQYFAELLFLKYASSASKRVSKLERLGYINIELKYSNNNCIGRIITPTFNFEEDKSPYPQNVPMEEDEVLPNGNRVVPMGTGVVPERTRVVPMGTGGSSCGNTINNIINKNINNNINKDINNILDNTGANILGQTQVDTFIINNFSSEEVKTLEELEENPVLEENPELEEINNEPSTERIEEEPSTLEKDILALEKIKTSLTPYLSLDSTGNYLSWNWKKEIEENDLYDFKLIALKNLGQEELPNSLIQLLDSYYLKNKIINLQLK